MRTKTHAVRLAAHLLMGLWGVSPAADSNDLRKQQSALGVSVSVDSSYSLGPGDEFSVWALNAEELSQKPVRIGTDGYVTIPLAGRLRAAGLTLSGIEEQIKERLKKNIQEPEVVVSLTDVRSQPVSVLGAVNRPGIHQIQGQKTLVEMLSLAEGIRSDAGYSVKITRPIESGTIPLPHAIEDASGKFSVATVNLKSLMNATNPSENVLVRARDVITVPRGQLVYVIGEVRKPGGFVLQDRETVSVLQVLSLAEGMGIMAAPKAARILRPNEANAQRTEIFVDLKKVLAGTAKDVPLQPEDILFVPSSKAKGISLRGLDAAVQIGTGLAIWRL